MSRLSAMQARVIRERMRDEPGSCMCNYSSDVSGGFGESTLSEGSAGAPITLNSVIPAATSASASSMRAPAGALASALRMTVESGDWDIARRTDSPACSRWVGSPWTSIEPSWARVMRIVWVCWAGEPVAMRGSWRSRTSARTISTRAKTKKTRSKKTTSMSGVISMRISCDRRLSFMGCPALVWCERRALIRWDLSGLVGGRSGLPSLLVGRRRDGRRPGRGFR